MAFLLLAFILTISQLGTSTRVGEVQTAHLTFRSDSSPETYNLTVKADGSIVKTGHDTLPISHIDAPDYLARSFCHFQTPRAVNLSTMVASDGITQQVVLNPVQPVLSVLCHGQCVYTYGACYDTHNQFVGPCCNGLCVATRCRPWNLGHHGEDM
ncbi:hypothetical protein CP532_5473 [Ophiocordyceps camponoti-leonardi (nom. inval.)]|nr:hypothetical protein CP532_5473 [Ophiocordyceps camponoti-leonardi (nom. inval.)]